MPQDKNVLHGGIGGSARYGKALLPRILRKKRFSVLVFFLAKDKCQWIPEQQVTWLGNIIDMISGTLFITGERIMLLEMAKETLLYQVDKDQYSLVPVKVLASFVGQIFSLQNVVGEKVR